MADDALNPNQELFCNYYTKNEALFGNATLSYARGLCSLRPARRNPERKIIDASPRTKAYNVCSVEGHRLLRSPKVQHRITALLNEILKDEVVDSQLAKLIKQDSEPATKIAAIREYNNSASASSTSKTSPAAASR